MSNLTDDLQALLDQLAQRASDLVDAIAEIDSKVTGDEPWTPEQADDLAEALDAAGTAPDAIDLAIGEVANLARTLELLWHQDEEADGREEAQDPATKSTLDYSSA